MRITQWEKSLNNKKQDNWLFTIVKDERRQS